MSASSDDDVSDEEAPSDTVVVAPRRHLIKAPRRPKSDVRDARESDPASDPLADFVVPDAAEASLLQTRLREHHRGKNSVRGKEKSKKSFNASDLGSVQWARSEVSGLKIRVVESDKLLLRGQAQGSGGSLVLGLDSKRYTVAVTENANAWEVALSVQNRLQTSFDVELAKGPEGVLLKVRAVGEPGWSS